MRERERGRERERERERGRERERENWVLCPKVFICVAKANIFKEGLRGGYQ